MRFALTGAHGTGKSSVLNSQAEFLATNQIDLMNNSSSARHISKSGMAVNENGDDLVQLIVQSSHVQKFCKDRWFTDRSVIDGFAYTDYLYKQGKVNFSTWETTHRLMEKFLPLYDHLFYVPIEFEVTTDAVRSADTSFQKDIDKIIYHHIQPLLLRGKATTLTGTVERRAEQIKSVLSHFFP